MKQLPIGQLKTNPRNPRTITKAKVEELKKSISELSVMGGLKPIITDEAFVILAGNQRHRAYTELGWEKVPVNVFDKKLYKQVVKEREERGTFKGETYEDVCDEIMLRDNVNLGLWDFEMIADTWGEDKANEYGIPMVLPVDQDEDDASSFQDDGISVQNNYGVIVMCDTDDEQQDVYNRLTEEGFKCKVVVV